MTQKDERIWPDNMTEYKSTKIQQELFSFGERDGDRLASMGESR